MIGIQFNPTARFISVAAALANIFIAGSHYHWNLKCNYAVRFGNSSYRMIEEC
jgi:hypothetical protein